MPFKLLSTRSAMKALTWRALATTTTIVVAFFVTGRVDLALSIGGIEIVAKMLIYYFHERVWDATPQPVSD